MYMFSKHKYVHVFKTTIINLNFNEIEVLTFLFFFKKEMTYLKIYLVTF